MADQFLDVLRARRAPVLRGQAAHLPGSGYAALDGDKAVFADPRSEKVESDDSQMRHRFRISTPAVDRAGDVVLPRGCEAHLGRYQKNPVVFYSHASHAFPIARSVSPDGGFGITVRDDGLFADGYFHGRTYESEKTYELLKLGYLNATSIGFRPLKAALRPETRGDGGRGVLDFEHPGLDFLEWELLEWSVVGVPCNHEALDGLKSWASRPGHDRDNPLTAAVRAMLAAGGGTVVTATVPAAPPPGAPKEAPPAVTDVAGVKVEAFTEDEIARAIRAAAGEGALTPNELRELRGEKVTEVKDQDVPAPDGAAADDSAPPAPAPLATPDNPLVVAPDAPDVSVHVALGVEGLVREVDALKAANADLKAKVDALLAPPTQTADPGPPLPLGAQALREAHRRLADVCGYLCSLDGQVEHPKVAPFLADLAGRVEAEMKGVLKAARKTYPDLFPAPDADGAKAEPAPEAKAEGGTGPAAGPGGPPPAWAPAQLAALAAALDALRAAQAENRKTLTSLTGRP